MALGKPVKALVRETTDPAKVARLTGMGVQVLKGNLIQPNTLIVACQGVGTVIATVSSMPVSYQPGENDIQLVDLEGAK